MADMIFLVITIPSHF